MRGGTLTLPDGTVETATWGPAPDTVPTLVLLHEGLGCVELWRDVPERLAAATGWGVFAYSRFGYGRSDPLSLPRPLTYMQLEAQLVLPQMLSQAGIRRAVLIGHSDGGSIATIYAGQVGAGQVGGGQVGSGQVGGGQVGRRLKPSRVMAGDHVMADDHVAADRRASAKDRVMGGAGQPPTTCDAAANQVANPGTTPQAADPGRTTSLDAAPCTLLGLVTIAAHFFVEDLNIASIRRIKQDYETGDLRPRLARYHDDVDIAFRGWNDAWLDPGFRAFDITSFLPDIVVPVLGLQGADDPYGTAEQLRVLQAGTRAPTETVLIPNARHAPHLEAKTETLAAITRFVAGLPTGTRT